MSDDPFADLIAQEQTNRSAPIPEVAPQGAAPTMEEDPFALLIQEEQNKPAPSSNPRLDEIKAAGKDFQVGSQLYEGTETSAQQEEIYEYLKAQGGNSGGVFRDNFNGQAIPRPSKSATTDFLGDIPFIGGVASGVVEGFSHYEDVIGQEIMDVSKEAVSFGAALVDQVGQIVGHDPELSKKWDDVNSSHTTEGVVDTLVGEGAKLAVAAAVTAGPTVLAAAGSKAAAAWKLIKIDAIYSMTADKEQEVGIMRTIKNATGDSEWGMQKDLSEKMNVFIDSMLLAGVFKLGAGAVRRPATLIKNKLINPVVALFGGGTKYMNREAMEEVMFNVLKDVPADMSDEKVIQVLSKGIKENLKDIIPSEAGDVVIENTTGQAINRTANDEVVRITEEIAKLKEAGGSVKDIANLERDRGYWVKASKEALNLERSSLGKRTTASPQLTSKLEGQKRIFTDNLEEGNIKYGGEESTEILKDELTSSVQRETNEAFELAESHAMSKASLENELQGLAKDSDFFKVLEEVETNTGINITKDVDKNVDKVKSVMKEVYTKMADTRSAKYESAREATNKVGLPPKFFDMINAEQGVLPKLILDDINSGSKPSGDILRSVTKSLSDSINGKNPMVQLSEDQLNNKIELRKYITGDLIDDLLKSSDPLDNEAGRLSREATTYDRDEFNKVWGGDLGKLAKDFKDTRINPEYPEANEAAIATAEKNSRKKIEALYSGRSRELGVVANKIMEKGGDTESVGVMLKSQAAIKLLNKMEKGKTVDTLTAEEIRRAFKGIISQNPELEDQIEPFFAEFKRLKGDLTEQTKMLELAVKESEIVEDRLQGQIFSEWFTKNAKGMGYDVDAKSGTSIVSSIMENSESAVNTLTTIVSRMTEEGNTMAIKGLQSGYYRFLRKKFVGNDGLVDVKSVNDLLKNRSNIRQELDVLFPDDTNTVKTTLAVLENIASKRAIEAEAEGMMRVQTKNDNYIKDTAMQTVNAGITYAYGILNPTAAKARIAAKYASQFKDPGARYLQILDTVYANPQEFSLILDEAYKGGTSISSEGRQMLKQFFYKGLIQPAFSDDMTETEEAMSVQ
jgi:hypothetical protein